MPDPQTGSSLVAWAGTSLAAVLAGVTAAVGWGRATTRISEHDRRLKEHDAIIRELRQYSHDTSLAIVRIDGNVDNINTQVGLCPRMQAPGNTNIKGDPGGC